MKDSLDITQEITKLIKKSPPRDEKLKSELAPDTPGVRVLCPTRWTAREDSLKSILDNFEVLQELWEEAIDLVKDTEMKARINGVATQMKTFDYLASERSERDTYRGNTIENRGCLFVGERA